MNRIAILTRSRLQRALDQVVRELDSHGFLTARLQDVDVCLGTIGYCHGYFDGRIVLPVISACRLAQRYLRGWRYYGVRGTLRHEFGHAVADLHSRELRKMRFASVFGGSYESSQSFFYDPEFHISGYAATCPSEDFAEVFESYVRHGGRLPLRYEGYPHIASKFRFVQKLGRALKRR